MIIINKNSKSLNNFLFFGACVKPKVVCNKISCCSYYKKGLKKENTTEIIINQCQQTAMRHGLRTKRLGRPADQRKALIRCLVTDVLVHGKIKTTQTRAKYIRKYVDKMITLSKKGSLHARRQMEAFIYNKKLVKAIIEEAPKRYGERNGGYCRVSMEIEARKGDAAKMA